MLVLVNHSFAQHLFESTRIVNAQSTEMLYKGELDVRITHKFGDIAGDNGGFHTLYGLDNAADVRIGFEYGITNKLMAGFGRSKGNFTRELFDVFLKLSLLEQQNDKPLSLVLFSDVAISASEKNESPNTIRSFNSFAQRTSYVSQLLIARKFTNWLTLQTMPTYTYRQLVFSDDEHHLVSLGVGGRVRISKLLAFLFDYNYVFDQSRTINGQDPTNPWGVGLEINTGGHTFFLNISNSRGIIENEFLPHTFSRIEDQEYRLGFTISRPFKIKK